MSEFSQFRRLSPLMLLMQIMMQIMLSLSATAVPSGAGTASVAASVAASVSASASASAAISAAASAESICLNEVLYDPAGADQGAEYVELYNGTGETVTLQNWSLDAGNGAQPGDWREQWRGQHHDQIAPRSFFVIAGEKVSGLVDVVTTLSLQNGPDAVRLVAPDGQCADRLGWGVHDFDEYYEAAPVIDSGGGAALARTFDGLDSDNNAADWTQSAALTPGRTNHPSLAVQVISIACNPPLFDPGYEAQLLVELSNYGSDSIADSQLEWQITGTGVGVDSHDSITGGLAPGEERIYRWRVTAGEPFSPAAITVRLLLADQLIHEETLRLRIGRGPVLVAEILYDPGADEGEWIELYNRSAASIDLSSWGWVDASGRQVIFEAGQQLRAGQRRLVAQKPAQLLASDPTLSSADLIPYRGAWPGLNNSLNRDLGFADQVLLFDSLHLPCDLVTYTPGDLDGGGISLERWIEADQLLAPELLIPCSAPGGVTPGRGGWQPESGENRDLWLNPAPDPFFPDQITTARYCRLAVPSKPGQRVSGDVYSLAGRRLATLITGADAAGPLVLLWDARTGTGDPVPTGLYLIRIVIHDETIGGAITMVRTVTVARG